MANEIKLDLVQRLILTNQFRILEQLDKANAEHHQRAQTTLIMGYELSYGDFFSFFESQPLTRDECEEVVDILCMCDELEQSYAGLEDKSGIEDWHIKFFGFDGNNEGRQLGFARHFIESGNRFTHYLNRNGGLDSHVPTLDTYRRMLKAWKRLKRQYPLTKEQIQQVATEHVHPDNKK